MHFDYSDKVKDMRQRLLAFMDEHIYPNEGRFFAEIAASAGSTPACSRAAAGRVRSSASAPGSPAPAGPATG